MLHYIYRTNNTPALVPGERLSRALPIALGLIVLIAIISPLNISPVIYLLAGSIIAFLLIYFYRKKSRREKDILLKIEDHSIEYFSEEHNNLITIKTESITDIKTRFCELQIITRDNRIHKIDMSSFKTEQTRWEVKELVKQLVQNS